MKNPRILEPIIAGAKYELPTFKVTNDGLQDAGLFEIPFCKGNVINDQDFRQEGVFTESLIQVAKQYLEHVNVGELASRETAMAITKLDEAIMWLNKRAEDRKLREVQGTYQK